MAAKDESLNELLNLTTSQLQREVRELQKRARQLEKELEIENKRLKDWMTNASE